MIALLDTHVFLWWITDSPQLSKLTREVIGNSNNRLFFSSASGWEIAIKASIGKITVQTDNLFNFISMQLEMNSITPLPVQMNHALHVHQLPLLHRDPFDRMLIAQALLENMPIVTEDRQIGKYYVETIW